MTDIVNIIKPDLIKCLKKLSDNSNCWFIHCFQKFKYESAQGWVVHRFKDRFNEKAIVQAFEMIMNELARCDIDNVEAVI